MRRFGVRTGMVFLVVVACLCFTFAVSYAQDKKPDATVELTAESVAAGIGLSWGSGALNYNGKLHPISVSGLSVGAVGITSASSSGKVYNLKKLEDFPGHYVSFGAGATVGGGGAAVAMKNQNGVVIELVTTTQGVDIQFATGGVDIKLK